MICLIGLLLVFLNKGNDMRSIKVIFSNGNSLVTDINGTDDQIRAHYIGRVFNFGDTDTCPSDVLVKAIEVIFL